MLKHASKPCKIAFYILIFATLLVLVYFDFLNRGPLHLARVWLSYVGLHSTSLAIVLAWMPFCMAEACLIFVIDRYLFSKKEVAPHPNKPTDGS
ncbi:MAG: hypothetical protein NTV51_06940 [Verrucomicrobia bacterium]|nr:hypothetical protein [Verrucomicrobiota bacterium]